MKIKLDPLRKREIEITEKMIDGSITNAERKELQKIQMKRFMRDMLEMGK